MARTIAGTAATLDCALDVELWTSQLLGMFWRARNELSLTDAAGMDPALVYGEPLLRRLSRIADDGAAIAVMGLAELEDGELGCLAKETLDQAGLWTTLPTWAADIGESAIVGAAIMRDPVFDDGRTVFLESRHADGATLAVGVFIDRNLGGIAKDVLLAESIDQVEQTMHDHVEEQPIELVLDRIEPGVAAGLIRGAIATTDITWDPPVGEDYWNWRALAVLRCAQTPNVVEAEDPTEMPLAEREALCEEFLASPEASGFASDGDEAWVASLAINFAADYAGGDPLRWSPVVIELFMADWVPRKVFTTDEFLAKLPDALDAWVRFAARKRAVPAEAIVVTRAAIGEFTDEMSARASDPDLGDGGVWDARVPEETILQVKVRLARVTKPPVWRRLRLPAQTSLDELHMIIQAAFGWEDSHLHVFEVEGEVFGPADPELGLECGDERQVTLAEFIAAGDRARYTYDFGDGWDHEIVIEKILTAEPGVEYPLLVTAKGACPPEDCGGVWGYSDLKAILDDPDDEQYQAAREWLGLADGDPFDPRFVDLEAITARLASRSPSASG